MLMNSFGSAGFSLLTSATTLSFILAETAFLNCALLVTHDAHLHGIDFPRTTFLFRSLDLTLPVIAAPLDLIRKFYS